MKNVLRKMMMAVLFLSFTTTISAQRYQSMYAVKGDRAYFDGRVIPHADVRSFQILGYGYAKDRNNVYLDGQILRFVDPLTFRLHGNPQHGLQPVATVPSAGHGHGAAVQPTQPIHDNRPGYGNDYYDNRRPIPGYMITNREVYFDGRRLSDASHSSFKDLGDGYGRDAFNVYYFGEKIQGATGSSFKLIGEGYSKDAFNVYYYGKKIRDAHGSTFKLLGYGYSKDSFNVYYNNEKIPGANANTFKVDADGYAHDSFDVYYYGQKVKDRR